MATYSKWTNEIQPSDAASVPHNNHHTNPRPWSNNYCHSSLTRYCYSSPCRWHCPSQAISRGRRPQVPILSLVDPSLSKLDDWLHGIATTQSGSSSFQPTAEQYLTGFVVKTITRKAGKCSKQSAPESSLSFKVSSIFVCFCTVE